MNLAVATTRIDVLWTTVLLLLVPLPATVLGTDAYSEIFQIFTKIIQNNVHELHIHTKLIFN